LRKNRQPSPSYGGNDDKRELRKKTSRSMGYGKDDKDRRELQRDNKRPMLFKKPIMLLRRPLLMRNRRPAGYGGDNGKNNNRPMGYGGDDDRSRRSRNLNGKGSSAKAWNEKYSVVRTVYSDEDP
jgi:hypothetical protein